MALGDLYASLADLKTRLDITDTTDDDRLTDALTAASREIEQWCGRQFNDVGSTSVRTFRPRTCEVVAVDDFSTTMGLVVKTDANDDGTYETTWASSDYELEPLDGVVAGSTGWPYYQIRAVGSYLFPVGARRAVVQVTAQWGWSAVPSAVREACLIAAAELFKVGDAPFGVAGYGEFGPVRVRLNSRAMQLLAPYQRHPVMVA